MKDNDFTDTPIKLLCSLDALYTQKGCFGFNIGRKKRDTTIAPHAGANAWLYLHLENSKSKKGHNFVKKFWRIISPTGMGSPFDSERLF